MEDDDVITAEQVRMLARKNSLRPEQQEKDYVLRILLSSIYRKGEGPVFKGGTCLRFCYGLNRFSEDLDFSIRAEPGPFRSMIRDAARSFSDFGIGYDFRKEEIFEKQGAYACTLRFRGPLWDGKPQSQNSINVDAGKRTGIMLAPEWKMIGSEYPDLGNFMAQTMQEGEIFAEKASALFTRKKGRDLYDAWFLAWKGIAFDRKLFEQKMQLAGVEPSFSLVGRAEYERDVERLVPRALPYEAVVRDVREFFGAHGINLAPPD